MNEARSASAASSASASSGSRASSASRPKRFGSAPFSRIASAVATACSLITSWASSRPTPARTAAMSTLVVARNGR
ncbi:Uncharacterised protein [Mycobacteroides abscessus subsp. abscessus]|nr:Uncharacterised protein [Mycobacteroides abscessus subsp. abscessus]